MALVERAELIQIFRAVPAVLIIVGTVLARVEVEQDPPLLVEMPLVLAMILVLGELELVTLAAHMPPVVQAAAVAMVQ
jgi:hypothetical protein